MKDGEIPRHGVRKKTADAVGGGASRLNFDLRRFLTGDDAHLRPVANLPKTTSISSQAQSVHQPVLDTGSNGLGVKMSDTTGAARCAPRISAVRDARWRSEVKTVRGRNPSWARARERRSTG